MDKRDELEIREAIWWNLSPGEIGYNQPLEEFLGVSEREWRFYKLTGIKPAPWGGGGCRT